MPPWYLAGYRAAQARWSEVYAPALSTYPPLKVAVRTPRLTLAATTDDLLGRLVPVFVPVWSPTASRRRSTIRCPSTWTARPGSGLDAQDLGWSIAGRATFWRLYFVICDDAEQVGMQDPIGTDFAALGSGMHVERRRPEAVVGVQRLDLVQVDVTGGPAADGSAGDPPLRSRKAGRRPRSRPGFRYVARTRARTSP